MRTWTLSMVVIGLMVSMVGCQSHPHSHGVCDCQYDDYCAARAPWIRMGAPAVPAGEPIPAPSKLPEVKSGL